MRSATIKRCSWVSVDDPLMLQYHDREWGVPVHDDRKHFEFLVLEGAQAGLSWSIVLKKREGYRRAFSRFDHSKQDENRIGCAQRASVSGDSGRVRKFRRVLLAVRRRAATSESAEGDE